MQFYHPFFLSFSSLLYSYSVIRFFAARGHHDDVIKFKMAMVNSLCHYTSIDILYILFEPIFLANMVPNALSFPTSPLGALFGSNWFKCTFMLQKVIVMVITYILRYYKPYLQRNCKFWC